MGAKRRVLMPRYRSFSLKNSGFTSRKGHGDMLKCSHAPFFIQIGAWEQMKES